MRATIERWNGARARYAGATWAPGPAPLGIAAGLAVVALGPSIALAHGDIPVDPPTVLGVLTTWTFEPTVTIPLLAAALAWLAIVRRIGTAHPDSPVPLRRTVAFLGGLVATAVALTLGIERYDDTLFAVHMIQHMLLVFVAAPLIALGAPITQLLRVASPSVRSRWILPILHSRIVTAISHPVVAWLLFASVMWISHFSPLFEMALEDDTVHQLEHALFLVTALLFWWPVVALDPSPHRLRPPARLMYAFLQMPQNSFLAMALLFAEDPLYPHYVELGSPYGIDPLADQKLAAGFMWFGGDLIFLGVLIALLAIWIRSEERDTAAAERRADAEREAIERRADELARRRAEGASGAGLNSASGSDGAGLGGSVAASGGGQLGSGEASRSR